MYHNRAMNREPENVSFDYASATVAAGQPIVVVLEPGDATRYRLLIVPCWNAEVDGGGNLSDIGIPSKAAREFLMVTQFDDLGGMMFFASRNVGEHDLGAIKNEWTRTLLTWWVNQLWESIIR